MIATERLTVHGIDLEVLRGGEGDPIVLLHGMRSLTAAARFPALLAALGAVLAPSCPGFGTSSRPKNFDDIHDLVHLQRAVLDAVPGERITLVGLSFGGWLAAEVAAQGHSRLARLVLVDPVGIKISDRETADILDVFNRSPAEVRRAEWHDPDRFAPDFDAMEDAEIVRHARDWEALCLYAWHPVHVQSRNSPVGWAASRYRRWSFGEIATGSFRRTMVAPSPDLIPGARFATIADCGHHPEIERPEQLAALIGSFVRG